MSESVLKKSTSSAVSALFNTGGKVFIFVIIWFESFFCSQLNWTEFYYSCVMFLTVLRVNKLAVEIERFALSFVRIQFSVLCKKENKIFILYPVC